MEQMSLLAEATCRNGHNLTTAGTYQRKDGSKTCRDCIRERDRNRNVERMRKRKQKRTAKTPSATESKPANCPPEPLLAAPVAEGHDHDTGQRWTIDAWRAAFPQTWERLAASPVILQDLEHF